jgi:peptidoglycan hydrolase-like protein with peptidoglycan-binding domain
MRHSVKRISKSRLLAVAVAVGVAITVASAAPALAHSSDSAGTGSSVRTAYMLDARTNPADLPATAAVSCTSYTYMLVNRARAIVAAVPTVGYNTGNWHCELGIGNFSSAVGTLQRTLDDCNLHARLAIDDDYGPLTSGAVRSFQRAAHISIDGIYGPQTGGALSWLDNKGGCVRFL